MSSYSVVAERTQIAVRPGSTIWVEHPLNQGDVVGFSLSWAGWLGSETVSSATWSADSGIGVSNQGTTSTDTTATLTASGSALGNYRVEVIMTTSGGQIRSVLLMVRVVRLRED